MIAFYRKMCIRDSLDTKQVLLRDVLLSRGTVNASLISPRAVLIQALCNRAVTMISCV